MGAQSFANRQILCHRLTLRHEQTAEQSRITDMIEQAFIFVFTKFGLPGQDFSIMLLISTGIGCACVILGWLADSILEAISFGVIQNGIIMLIGAAITFWLWGYFGMTFKGQWGALSLCAAGFGGGVMLALGAILRKFI
jgi:uncharacterized membrane protein YeaQ/YmgE (transglycosylase-associated protein family)